MPGKPDEFETAVRRFDERDTVFSREALVEGSPEEREYHARHPERVDVDRRLARFIVNKMAALEGREPGGGGAPGEAGGAPGDAGAREAQLGVAVYDSLFVPAAALALPDMVDGAPFPSRVGFPLPAADRIKAYSRAIGADDVRIGPLRSEWIYSRRGARPFFREAYVNPPYFNGMPDGYSGARYGDPIRLAHPHAIVMAFAQDRDLIWTGSTAAVDFEVGRVYAKSALVSVHVARFIRALGFSARSHHLRSYSIILPPVAVDAGIGELGRCGYVVSRALGANFRLAAVTTDMPLEHDGPVDIGMRHFCETCGKCATSCPAGAIPRGGKTLVNGTRRWKLDEEACLLYWGKTGYSCGVCQAVCPWTKPRTAFHRGIAAVAANVPSLHRALLAGDDLVYGSRFRAKGAPAWLRK